MELASFLHRAERVCILFFGGEGGCSQCFPEAYQVTCHLLAKEFFFLRGIWEALGREESNSNLPGKGPHKREVGANINILAQQCLGGG